VTMIRPPASAPAQPSPDPAGPGRRQVTGVHVRVTTGGYLLGALAAGASALILPAVAPGKAVASYFTATAAVVVILLVSMIAHELGHAVALRRYRGRADATVGFLGGIGHGRAELPSARAQWQVAVAGPLVSLLLAALSLAALVALGGPARTGTLLPATVAAASIWINGLLTVANLIPAAGLDGGRIVRALAWARSGDPTRAILISARFGQVTGAILAAAGITAIALHHVAGVWASLLGILMVAASRAEAGQAMTSAALAGLRVRDILPAGQPAPVARGWQSVESFLAGDSELGLAPAPPGVTAFAVRDFDGQLTGLVTRGQLSVVPRGRRPVTRLSQAATPVDHLVFTTPDEPLSTLRARLSVRPAVPAARYTAGHVLVLGADGELAGVLTPADFTRAAQPGARRSAPPGRGGEPG
jgi:Zn-dependent protease